MSLLKAWKVTVVKYRVQGYLDNRLRRHISEKFLHGVEGANFMTTEACGATNCTMVEMGGATSSIMKVHRATKSN